MPFAPYLPFWAKTADDDQDGIAFHPIVCHGLDVAATVGAILDSRPTVLYRTAAVIGAGEAECRSVLVALAALHDIGKFAPAFQSKAPEFWPAASLGTLRPGLIQKTHHTDDGYRLWYHHLRDLVEKTVWPGAGYALDAIAPAIFGHHGRPVSPLARTSLNAKHVFGDVALSIALQCATDVLNVLGASLIGDPPPRDTNARLASWLIAGLMTTADWIGSRRRWFPFQQVDDGFDLTDYWARAQARARDAVAREGLALPRVARNRSFVQLTGISAPTVAQQWASDVALPESPVLIILEDVTGAGKTEAAQMLVHRLIAKGFAAGAYWAMPTQATANAMYERQHKALAGLFETPNGTHEKPSLILAHGQSALDPVFRSTVLEVPVADAERERVQDDLDVPSSVLCAEFFANDSRAALLADVGAGTIDQALLGVLPSRFNAMRLLGLHDKVLVIDEAHAYDAYMSAEMEALLRFQSTFGGSAIVLSATLPQRKRADLVKAWAAGFHPKRTAHRSAPATSFDGGSSYPLATVVTRNQESEADVREYPLESALWSRRTVPVRFLHSAPEVESEIASAARAGAAVVWIRNTVRDCLAAAESLSSVGIEAAVFHARFAHCDRQAREREVVATYGKNGSRSDRARVLVATQVVEQSLDLDFDVMFSDVAPVDLLIQRAGRLWRHGFRDSARPAGIGRELVVLAPPFADDPDAGWLKSVLPGTNAVYRNTGVLWRTVRVLIQAGAIVTPTGLRDLVEGVYGTDDVPEALQAATDQAMMKEKSNRAVARFAVLNPTDGYSGGAVAWESDLRAVTRLGEAQTTLRLAVEGADGTLAPWAGETDGPPWKAWALSEVRVASRRVPFAVTAAPEYMQRVEAARARWRRFDEGIPIVPLVRAGEDEWVGTLVKPDKSLISLRYSRARGLDFE